MKRHRYRPSEKTRRNNWEQRRTVYEDPTVGSFRVGRITRRDPVSPDPAEWLEQVTRGIPVIMRAIDDWANKVMAMVGPTMVKLAEYTRANYARAGQPYGPSDEDMWRWVRTAPWEELRRLNPAEPGAT